eukprot:7630538-Karenia_brevis.AAC.1
MAMTKMEIPLAPHLFARTWAPEHDRLLWNKADRLDINYMARLLAKGAGKSYQLLQKKRTIDMHVERHKKQRIMKRP